MMHSAPSTTVRARSAGRVGAALLAIAGNALVVVILGAAALAAVAAAAVVFGGGVLERL
ncbi:hypothetical protein ACFUTX_09755 [Microbacterium sp. NPDC057407]|uniref:hypothetical protein n=1 Tax=Microbacterium sp. NPDC057407 TaxID=3346120 RepID=UPI003672E90A